ncbi:MAG: hypothetical protein U5L45_23320 [Saprospiraceae bacterium]|nr:hypothetical protein [Saprospiraceae bacterium]
MVRFSAKPKNELYSPPSRARSAREMQKTLLGYAHSSSIKIDRQSNYIFSFYCIFILQITSK